MSVVVALIRNQIRLQRLRAAARDAHALIPCDSWDQLLDTCDGQIVHVAVLDLEALSGPDFDPVRLLKQRCPRIALIAYSALSQERVRHIFDAGRYGFEELVIAELDDGPSAFARALERSAARGVAGIVKTGLPQAADPLARDALLISITRAHERLTPASLMRILGISSRKLSHALARCDYPSAHKLIMWGRLIVAAALLDDTRHSADRIALTLSFPSGSAFRNNCRRYLGATPLEVRHRGGADWVLAQLRLQISATRTARPIEVDRALAHNG
ncbi:MAG: helix-turn-helix domain-containing protein [Gemmatimonadaceae bacterium]